jgi:hypothetical protein
MTHPIKFSPGNHQYRLDGKPVKGVTTLLNGGLPKPALPPWAARTVAEYVADNREAVAQLYTMGRWPMVNALKGIPWEQRDQAAAKGTDVHSLAEDVVHGREVEVPAHLVGHVEGYARFLDQWDVQPILVERMVANREHWYAGTFDLIATVKGEPMLLDLKTSKGIYGEVALQVAAYRFAEFYQDDDGLEQPMPEVARVAAVHVREDGTDLIPLESSDKPFRCFLHIAWVAKQSDAIKTWVGQPATLDEAAAVFASAPNLDVA